MGAPDVLHSHIVVHHALQVALKISPEQAHEKVDFRAGAAQVVFMRKRIKREPGKADTRRGLSYKLHGVGALLVAEEALQRAAPGPAAIAVHDDGHMLGQAFGLQRRVNGALFRGQFVDAQRARRIQRTRLYLAFGPPGWAQVTSKLDALNEASGAARLG